MLELYEQLLHLTKTNEAFYYKDYGSNWRVFNYRLASYSDFCLPGALEARGITFSMEEDTPTSIICRPWKKFFNLGENPFTIGLDLTRVRYQALKEDGSLICTYYDPFSDQFGVKSKQDFYSTQSKLAEQYLSTNPELRDFLEILAITGNTVIMELVSPINRIVVEYPKTELRILGVRGTYSGEVLDLEEIKRDAPASLTHLFVNTYKPESVDIPAIESMEGIEGYVFTMDNGLMFKLKTDWYKALHHLKDSVSSDRRLFEAIILETVDDVITMFPGDEIALARIRAMQEKVIPKYNHVIATVEEFFDANKSLDRKSYAIKGRESLGLLFSLAMNKYLDLPVDYKAFAFKYRVEYFGVKDEG